MIVENADKESTIAESILSLFSSYFGIKQPKRRHSNHHKNLFVSSGGGLQPHTPTRTTDAYITPQTVTAPITIIDDRHDHPEDWAYLSKSESTISTAGSSWSSVHNNTVSHHRASISSITLSEILCDHYVQTHSSGQSNQEPVPLETYKVFEASRRNSAISDHLNSSDGLASPNEDEDDDDESWFIWDNLQKTREWIQVVDEELFLPKEKVTTEVTIAVEPKSRGTRANSAHLRMIVAEVNMMRANKIVCPLRARGSLPARHDTFTSNTPSPLSV
ncbi:hypothetical protein HMPREF1544_08525 [Mucor circinelloides 1006PhL]|uniref:Uncharacterized protein n=1 Tax=Mucor circinelloides f. circinelloides (strain 1006PhL) TaxID=1220926 RepID=S2J3K9_MUCC1|nr:hypothetical protein HMPREF1544_08525 [Mucor circinelloides 1006PhL]